VPVGLGPLLPADDPGALAAPVPVPLVPGAAVTGPAGAEEAAVDDGAARNRSFDWKVVQLDDVGMRGVYGGWTNVGGMEYVTTCPLVV